MEKIIKIKNPTNEMLNIVCNKLKSERLSNWWSEYYGEKKDIEDVIVLDLTDVPTYRIYFGPVFLYGKTITGIPSPAWYELFLDHTGRLLSYISMTDSILYLGNTLEEGLDQYIYYRLHGWKDLKYVDEETGDVFSLDEDTLIV